MTKKHSTKKALMTSVLSLLLCFSMLSGTTFAWFTDSATSANNIIKSGNLDVELYYQAEGQTDWTKVTDTTNVFKEDALWEPGHTEVVKLKIVNEGSLALKYQLGVNVASEVGSVNVNDEAFMLSDFIKFSIVDGAQTYTREQAIAAVDATATALKTAYNSTVTALDAKNDTDSDEKIVTMVVYMPTTVGNKANAKTGAAVPTINLGINLFATQQTSESDSFNNQYDKDAEFSVDVKNADELANVLKVGGKVKLVGDIQLSNSVEVPAGVAVELDLNGKTITGTKGRDADNNRIHVIVNNGILTIKDGTVKSAGNDGGSAIYNNAGATLTIEDVTLYGAPQSDPVYEAGVSKPFPSYAVNNYGNAVVNGATVKSYHGAIATGDNGVTVINDADIDVGLGQSTGITSYIIYSYDNAQVTVNGGKFAFTKQEIYVNGGNTFCELGTNPIMINGGNYIGTSFSTGAGREYVIKGGTFDADPSAYVADSYQAVENADGTWTVKPYAVSTAADLAEAIANGKTAVSISSDITLDAQLEVNGELTIYGNGNTITAPANGTRVVNVMGNTEDVTVTLVGVKLDAADKERGISFYNNSGDLDVTIIDCEITAKYYGVNVAGQNAKATLNIKDSTLTGYCAFQTYSPNTVATFDNCVLKGVNMGYNNNQYPTSNNFATVVVNSLANNSTLTFNNCTIIATEKDSATAPADQWPATQAHIIDHATGTTINWNNCTFIKNGVEVSAPESIN